MRYSSRVGITNGVALLIVIIIVAVPVTGYYFYFNKPITTTPASQSTSSTSVTSSQTTLSGPAPGFKTGGVSCGYGLTYGSPGGEGCIIYMDNAGNSTATAAGTCNLTYSGTTYAGTFSFSSQLAPNQSTGKVTCGESQEGPPAGSGTLVTGEIFLTDGQFVPYNGTAVS